MAVSISSWDSSSISTLFKSVSSSSTSDSTGVSSLASLVSEYRSITTGSYGKLLNAYYAKQAAEEDDEDTDEESIATKTLTAASELKDSTSKLLAQGSSSVFSKTSTTDSEGNTTTGYDTDKIYKAVSSFVDNYNTLLTAGGSSSTTGITTSLSSMANYSKTNSSLLSSIGISVDSNGKLSLDETTFKNSDMSTVKSLFNTSGGYAYQVSAQASMAAYHSNNLISSLSGYTASGSYATITASSLYNTYT